MTSAVPLPDPSVADHLGRSPIRRPTGTPFTRALGIAALVGIAWLVVFGLFLSPNDASPEGGRAHPLHPRAVGVAGLPGVRRHRHRQRSPTCSSGPAASPGTASPAPAPRWACCSWASPSSAAACGAASRGASSGRGTRASPPRRSCSSPTSATSPCATSVAPTSSGPSAAPIIALLAVLEVPLVHFSVKWWRPLHQNESVAEGKLNGLMLFSLFVGIIAFTLLYVWLVLHRQRVLAHGGRPRRPRPRPRTRRASGRRSTGLMLASMTVSEQTPYVVISYVVTLGGIAPVRVAHARPRSQDRTRRCRDEDRPWT